MTDDICQKAPMMTEKFLSRSNDFQKVEDIYQSRKVIAVTPKTWLKITFDWSWPGPTAYLHGEPTEIPAKDGFKGILADSIIVGIKQAFSIAKESLLWTQCCDYFNSPITLDWTTDPETSEPWYRFTFDAEGLIFVGAYTGQASIVI